MNPADADREAARELANDPHPPRRSERVKDQWEEDMDLIRRWAYGGTVDSTRLAAALKRMAVWAEER